MTKLSPIQAPIAATARAEAMAAEFATNDDAVDAHREEHGGWLPLLAAGRDAEARLARPVPGYTREDFAYSQACPSCGAPAHVGCRNVVSPNAVHAWRLVLGTVRS